MSKHIFRTVSSTLRTVGLRGTIDGDLLTIAPVGKAREFDLATAEGRRAWRLFIFAQKGRATKKREAALRKRKPESDYELLRAAGWI